MNSALIDHLLMILAAFTIALIVWKTIELYLPGLRHGIRAEQRPKDLVALDEMLEKLERGMPILSTIAALAPFLGLAATIVHIRAALALIGGALPDTVVVAGPIAKALGSTLLGLASAIPAAAAHNFFSRRLQLIENRVRRRLASTTTPGSSDMCLL